MATTPHRRGAAASGRWPNSPDSGQLFSDAAEARASLAVAGGVWRGPCASGGRRPQRADLIIAGGFCELGPDGKLYNSAAIVDASGPRAVYRKVHLWDGEKEIFAPGETAAGGGAAVRQCGVMICYDLEFPEWVRVAALSGADLIAVPVNWDAPGWPAPAGERSGEVVAVQAAAAANGVFIAVADRCGTERGVEWVGGSVIVRRGGYFQRPGRRARTGRP